MKNNRFTPLLVLVPVILFLSGCGGGGAGSSGSSVTNNGTLSNPSAYTLPTGVSTVPPTGSQAN